jgi:hypothetical protein
MERRDGVANAGDVGRALQRHLAQLRARLERRRAPRAPCFFKVVDDAAQVAAPLLQRRQLEMAVRKGLGRGFVSPPQPVDLARLLGGAREHAQHAAIALHRRIQIAPPLLGARDIGARRGVVQQRVGPGEPFRVRLVDRRAQAVAPDLAVGLGHRRLGIAHRLALDFQGARFVAVGIEQARQAFARLQFGRIEPDQRIEMPDRVVDLALRFIDLGQCKMRSAACGIERGGLCEGFLRARVLAQLLQQGGIVAQKIGAIGREVQGPLEQGHRQLRLPGLSGNHGGGLQGIRIVRRLADEILTERQGLLARAGAAKLLHQHQLVANGLQSRLLLKCPALT